MDEPEVAFRFARPDDKTEILRLVQNTWEWGDYIPFVLDEWLRDNGGRLFVGEESGAIVALNHLVFIGKGVGWLEGMRVKRDIRGRGVATRLAFEVIDYSRSIGMKKLRLAIAVDNIASIRHASKVGYKPLATYDLLTVPASYRGGFDLGEPDPDRLLSGKYVSAYHNLYCKAFRWLDVDSGELADFAQTGRLVNLNGRQAIHTHDYHDGNSKTAEIGLLEYDRETVETLASYFGLKLYESLLIVIPQYGIEKPFPEKWEEEKPYTVYEINL